MEKENLKFWESVEKTDPKFTKKVSYGAFNYTAIESPERYFFWGF